MKSGVNLKSLTSFSLNAICNEFIEIGSVDKLIKLIKKGELKHKKILILGGGSNLLFRNNFKGLIIKPLFDAVRVVEEDDRYVLLECEAGRDWDMFVEYCVKNLYGGVENLSYIPGNVGAAPMQNIGAYGTEVSSVIDLVNTIDLESGESRSFKRDECNFAYRNSIFKRSYKNKLLITSVRFKLEKNPSEFNTGYGIVEERVEDLGGASLRNIRDAIISIRKEKLPEPNEIGNAGSFFKNPVIEPDHFGRISEKYTDVPSYHAPDNMIKVPAGWLIEKCGWKGYRRGDAGVHKNQALVLVNYGNASGEEIYQLSEEIIRSVEDKFGILLEREVNVID